MVTDKEIYKAGKVSWRDNKDEEHDFEMDGDYFKSGFYEGAKWMQEKMKEEEACTWCGYIKKTCDCTLTQEHYDNEDKNEKRN